MAKRCSRCHHIKPFSAFRFLNMQRRFMSWCRQCESEHRKQSTTPKKTRDLAVRTVVELCKQHGTGILSDAVTQLSQENEHNG